MLVANVDGVATDAMPGGRGLCPSCDEEVIAHCGEVLVWHWAHRAGAECDTFSEGETAWHAQWKLYGRARGCRIEVTYRSGKEWHRADVVRTDGVNVELQHSPIDLREFHERVSFYQRNGGVAWLFDGIDRWDHLRADGAVEWTRAPRWLLALNKAPLFIDLGEGVLRRIHPVYDDADSTTWMVECEAATPADVFESPLGMNLRPTVVHRAATGRRAECISFELFTSAQQRDLVRWYFRVWLEDGTAGFEATGVTGQGGRRFAKWDRATGTGFCRVDLRNDKRWGWQVEDVREAPEDLVYRALEVFEEDVIGLGPRVLAVREAAA